MSRRPTATSGAQPRAVRRSPPASRPWFWLIGLAPLAAALALVAIVVARVVAINAEDPNAIAHRLADHLRGLVRSAPEMSLMDGTTSIETQYGFVPLDPPDDAAHLIYVVGASSVVLPSADTVFAAGLEQRLNRNGRTFRVANLGRVGITSGTMLATVRAALAVRAPDALILYEGHNDYNYAYREAVLPGSATLDVLARTSLRLYQLDPPSYWAMRSEIIDPRIGRWLQQLGLVRIDPALVDLVDAAALHWFESNVEAILAEAGSRGVPVVLITPISNLEIEPFGVGTAAADAYRDGMRAGAYADRVALLRRARDLDAFNALKRAKSGVGEYLRSRRGPGIHVLDLEQRLIDEQFGFNWDAFVDALHLRPETHARVAEHLHALLVDERVCRGLGAWR